MKKKSNFTDTPSSFAGACNQCGEVYQASSKSDDLEGISFRCKKLSCSGRVTLEVSASGHIHLDKYEKAKPHRLC